MAKAKKSANNWDQTGVNAGRDWARRWNDPRGQLDVAQPDVAQPDVVQPDTAPVSTERLSGGFKTEEERDQAAADVGRKLDDAMRGTSARTYEETAGSAPDIERGNVGTAEEVAGGTDDATANYLKTQVETRPDEVRYDEDGEVLPSYLWSAAKGGRTKRSVSMVDAERSSMKWEPKRRRAAEDAGTPHIPAWAALLAGANYAPAALGKPTVLAAAGHGAKTFVPVVKSAAGKASITASSGAETVVGGVARLAAATGAAAGGLSSLADAITGGKISAAHTEHVRRGDDDFWGNWLSPININAHLIERSAQLADERFLKGAIAVMKNRDLTDEQRRERLAELNRVHDEDLGEKLKTNASGGTGYLGRFGVGLLGGLASVANLMTGGAARSLVRDDWFGVGDAERNRAKTLEGLRHEYERLRRYGEYERAADDDERGEVFIQKVREGAKALAGVQDEDQRRRVIAAQAGRDAEFSKLYSSTYNKLVNDRRRAIFNNVIASALTKQGYEGVTYDQFANDQRFAKAYGRMAAADLARLDELGAQYLNPSAVWKPSQAVQKSSVDPRRNLMTGE